MKFNNLYVFYSGVSLDCAPRVKSMYDFIYPVKKVTIGGVVKSNDIPDSYDTSLVREFSGRKNVLLKCFSLLINFFLFFIACLVKIKEDDVIYAINPISGVAALFLKKIVRCNYVYETQEIFIGSGHRFFKGKLRLLWYHVEKKIVKESKTFIVTDQFRAKFLRRVYQVEIKKVDYIYNSPRGNFKPSYNIVLSRFPELQGKVIYTYCGAIIGNRGIEKVVKAFLKCRAENEVLLLVGYYDVEIKKNLDKLFESDDIGEGVFFTGKVSNDEILDYLACSYATFALYDPVNPNNRLNSPNKVFDALSLGVKLITTSTPLSRFLSKKYSVVDVKNHSLQSLCDAICVARDMPAPKNVQFPFTQEKLMPSFLKRVLNVEV